MTGITPERVCRPVITSWAGALTSENAFMPGVVVASAFVAEGPVLGWLDNAFTAVAAQMPIPADHLAPTWPENTCTPTELRVQMAGRAEDGQSTDPPWTAIVLASRQDGEQGRLWRLVACGLALRQLNAVAIRYHARDQAERCDIHADLVEGFLTALPKINLDRPNVARRLVDAARRQLRRSRTRRRTEIPADFDAPLPPGPAATPDSGPHNWTQALTHIAQEFTAAGHTLDPIGVELIGRTIIDRQTLTDAAHELGLTTEAAYKRRSRAEARIAAFYHIDTQRPASGRTTAVSRGATEDAA